MKGGATEASHTYSIMAPVIASKYGQLMRHAAQGSCDQYMHLVAYKKMMWGPRKTYLQKIGVKLTFKRASFLFIDYECKC